MLSAFFTSALFLVSYVVYHWFKKWTKTICRGAWFHLLSGTPNSHSTSDVNFAFSNDKRLQRYGFTNSAAQKIAKITFPIWLYVSITGIIIFVMLYL